MFENVAVYQTVDYDLNLGDKAVRITTARVSPDFFRVLGVLMAESAMRPGVPGEPPFSRRLLA